MQEPWTKRQNNGPWTKYQALDAIKRETLMESRKAASKAELEQNLPESTMASRAREMALGAAEGVGFQPAETIGGTAKKTVVNLATGLAKAPFELVRDPIHFIGGMVKGAVSGPMEAVEAFRKGDYNRMAHGVGGTVSTALPAAYGGATLAKALSAKGVKALATPERIQRLEERAAANMARSLKPTTLEGQAAAQRISPELLEKQITGTGRGIDKQIMAGLDEAGQNVGLAETRLLNEVRPEFQISKKPILNKIDDAVRRLYVRGTGATGHPDAVAALKELRQTVDQLPDYADFDQVIYLRRQFYEAIREGGGLIVADWKSFRG